MTRARPLILSIIGNQQRVLHGACYLWFMLSEGHFGYCSESTLDKLEGGQEQNPETLGDLGDACLQKVLQRFEGVGGLGPLGVSAINKALKLHGVSILLYVLPHPHPHSTFPATEEEHI